MSLGYRIRIAISALAVLVSAVIAHAADQGGLVADGAKVRKLADDFMFTEGPARDAAGNIYFSDIPNERIHKWSLDGKLTTFRESSGRANGLYFDKDGNLLACEGGSRRLTSTSPAGKVTVLADSFGGKKFNSPNDLWIDPKGAFTSPTRAMVRWRAWRQDGFHVYLPCARRRQSGAGAR